VSTLSWRLGANEATCCRFASCISPMMMLWLRGIEKVAACAYRDRPRAAPLSIYVHRGIAWRQPSGARYAAGAAVAASGGLGGGGFDGLGGSIGQSFSVITASAAA
jgi:hypothetical protein